MDGWRKDLAFAFRTLVRQPAFALIAVLTIGLAIGASTAIFSVVRAVLLRPLPYHEPDRLMIVWANLVSRNRPKFPISPPDLQDYQEQANLFEDFAGVTTFTVTITGGDGDPEQVTAGGATPNLLAVLGVRPLLGHDFSAEDAAPLPPNVDPATLPPNAVLLSYGLWQRRFGGSQDAIGRTLEINNNAAEIAGVLPRDFAVYFGPGAGINTDVDLWTTPRINIGAWPARRNVIWSVIGRLKPDVTVAQAQAQMDALAARQREADNLRETIGYRLDVVPMLRDLTAEVRPVVWALLGAVGFVLLIACANVSNLFLVRATAREREFAIRAALGGRRWRLIRQLLLESGVLAGAGGLLGLLVAFGGIRLLFALRPANLPRMEAISIDATVLGFSLAVSAAAALLFGLFPALQASRPALIDSLKDRGRSSSMVRHRLFRNGLVVAEVALSVMLLTGAGLMVRSFSALQRVNPGYDPENLLTFTLSLPNALYPNAAKEAFHRRFADQVTGLPGVTQVSAVFPLPLIESGFSGRYGTLEALNDQSLYGQADYRVVTPGYFETMGTRLLEGRLFSAAEFADSSAVVVVDNVLARILWPNQSAVGKRMLVRITTLDPQEVSVIGVVEHQRARTLAADGPETVYITNKYFGTTGFLTWVVRTRGDASGLAGQVRAELRQLDARLPMADVRTMQDRVDEARTGTRFTLVLIGVFGVLAVILASVGIYGVMADGVRQRTGEIGVRMAFGAERADILGLMLRHGMTLALIGLATGLLAAFGLTRLMRSFLVGVTPTDPLTFAVMAVLFGIVAALACYMPGRRATLVDPVVALREE